MNENHALLSRRPYYRSLDPFLHWPALTRPPDWAARFGRTARLELEVGYGNGEALVRRAGEHPEVNHVGLEISWESTKRALRRLAGERLQNVRLLMIEAHEALYRLWEPRGMDFFRALFPVPWPKDRHERRRIFSRDFLRLLNNRLADQGQALIVTDFEPLARWIEEQAVGTGLALESRAISARYQTKYERKWQAGGQETFFELLLTKEQHLDLPRVEDAPLFTLRLETFDPDHYQPTNHLGPVTVKFRDYLYDPRQGKALIKAFIAEDRLIQELWIRIYREDGGWHLGLAQKVNVVPSEGVKLALELAAAAAGAYNPV